MIETAISVLSSEALLTLFGARDQHLRRIRDTLGVRVSASDGHIRVEGEETAVARATEALEQLQQVAQRHETVSSDDVERVLASVCGGEQQAEFPPVEVFKAGRQIRPRTVGQARYMQAIRDNNVVLCCGPAGTGKTYLAVAMAVAALKREQIRKIVLVRPAVEAGESLGFLPGDLQAKINPYLRPLLDALNEMMDHELIRRYTEEDLIEVIPLAYMRGRTLNEAFIILDEAQNTTIAQMKMFLTRMGTGSRIVVSGDTTQIDLPPHTRSGLVDALARLGRIAGIGSVTLTGRDIVRHPLVEKIVRAYEPGPGRSGSRARRSSEQGSTGRRKGKK
jgi:phosphate starvation-inducible PhoH-like protein